MKILDSLTRNVPFTGTGETNQTETTAQTIQNKTALPQELTEAEGAIKSLQDQGYALSVEEQNQIKEFIEATDGTPQDKLQAVKSALDKGVPITGRVLSAIYDALFKSVLSESVKNMLDLSATGDFGELIAENQVFEVLQAVLASTEGAVGKTISSVEEQLIQMTAQDTQGLTNSGSVLSSETMETQIMSWVTETLEQLAQLVPENEMPVERHAAQAPERPEGSYKPFEKEDPVAPSVERSKESKTQERETEQPQDLETALEQWLTTAAAALQNTEQQVQYQPDLQKATAILMREITPVMQRVKKDFETFKNTTLKTLEPLKIALEDKSIKPEQAADKLEQAIKALDDVILKSDIPLYTSMKAEKQLMNLSSQLQGAKQFLNAGNISKAAEVVAAVEKDLKAMVVDPSRVKILYQAKQNLEIEPKLQKEALAYRMQQQAQRILQPAQTPREVLESFKALGLTHESEVAASISAGEKKGKDPMLPPDNLKTMLMQLAKETEEKMTTVTAAEQTYNQLTGQQLLSRPDGKPQGQTLFLSVPMKLADQVEDLKIYIQSRKDHGKIDWENCSFYFAVHTQSHGDVGMKISAVRKTVTVQIKSDSTELKAAVEPLAKDFIQAMGECGYRIAGISYSRMSDTGEPVAEPMAVDSNSEQEDGKGLNIKV